MQVYPEAPVVHTRLTLEFTVVVTFGHIKTTPEFDPTQPVLQSLHLDYAWRTRQIARHDDDASSPSQDLYDNSFSEDLTLPLQTLLDDVVTRFVKNSLVRYPTFHT